jgi:hypothetical protein
MKNTQVVAIMAAVIWARGGVDYTEAVFMAKEILAKAMNL